MNRSHKGLLYLAGVAVVATLTFKTIDYKSSVNPSRPAHSYSADLDNDGKLDRVVELDSGKRYPLLVRSDGLVSPNTEFEERRIKTENNLFEQRRKLNAGYSAQNSQLNQSEAEVTSAIKSRYDSLKQKLNEGM